MDTPETASKIRNIFLHARMIYFFTNLRFSISLRSMILSKTLLHTTDAYVKKLKEAGIETTLGFLEHFPRALENRSDIRDSFTFVNLKEKNTLRLAIESIVSERTRSGKSITKVILKDANGYLAEAVYFTKPYFLAKFSQGDSVILYGRAKYDYGKLSFPSPQMEKADGGYASLVPIYSDANYIPGTWFASKIGLLRPYLNEIEEVMPAEFRKKKAFRSRVSNVEALHFPKSVEDFERARSELAYEELFMMQYY